MVQKYQVRVREDGQVTLPDDVRDRLGLKTGDVLDIIDTPQGLLITSQELAVTQALDGMGAVRRTDRGTSLSVTDIRAIRELGTPPLPRVVDILGIEPDLTGDQTTDDWLEERRQRHEETPASLL